MSIIIRRGPNDTTDSVIRKFQKKIVLENVIQEYRDREYHKTESQKRQERRAEKVRKIMRARRLNAF
ncbi:MAG: 30S ribosomal protein S21 [Candidatus Daviesbacteria bacterium]|nr:30S ribosomal protein S21 [Candidatus Daviesbacteria bacterium]